MKIFAKKKKRSIHAFCRQRQYAHQPAGAAQQAQLAEIRTILRTTGVQARLTIGQPNDKYEREADRVSDRVMRMSNGDVRQRMETGVIQRMQIQRRCSGCEEEMAQRQQKEEDETVQAKLNQETLQRQEDSEEEEPVQAKETPEQTPHVSSTNESRINSFNGGGQPLDKVTRNYFEPRFGLDFSRVRVHQDGYAADVSRSINARAFTMGNNIVFDSGQYQPQSSEGKRLLGHELTHVVQQEGRGQGIQRKKRHELENDPGIAPSMSCPVANSSPAGYSLDITFGINSSTLSSGSIAAVENFVNNWHSSGETDPVRVDGYASEDGGPSINWPLSCSRAESLAHELMMPSRGVPGILSSSITLFAQGETNQFSSALGPNRRAQAHIPFAPVSNPLNIPDMRYSSLRKYVYGRGDATTLYGLNAAPGLVPVSGFNQQNTSYTDYTKQWIDGLGIAVLNHLGGDCGLYARELIRRTGRTPESYGTSRPGIGLAPANDLQPGEAYYIKPEGSGSGAVEEDVLSPWDNRQTVRKHLTNFHVAMVVAKDDSTAVTSEVNAAFPGRVRPWFSMYRGNRGFYRTYRREYRRGGVNPGLWRM